MTKVQKNISKVKRSKLEQEEKELDIKLKKDKKEVLRLRKDIYKTEARLLRIFELILQL